MSLFFKKLMSATEVERQKFQQIETLQRGSVGDISLESYQAFLIQAYYHVRHTTPLLMACGSHMPYDKE